MAALAAAHHRLRLYSSSAAAPTPGRRLRFSPRPSPHGRSISGPAARVPTPASGGGTSSAAAPPAAATSPSPSLSLEELRRGCTTWTWRGMRVNYLAMGQGPPVLLVHGFGASVAHWRRDNLKDILLSVYGNKDSVDDELVEIIRGPADTEGALDAFVSTVTGPPGPSPIALMPRLADMPVLVLWGDRDPFTPIDGPVGKFFSRLPSELPNVTLHMLEGVGHCPHDDRPDLVHERLLPWLDGLPPLVAGAAAVV
ncbi:hypothetical protein HU200_024485 [Digitaria exilis]|uniref:AB hydrolase-1 domain-containing protein n=1 Tax=Digitaria exilis TaxID=1010633 RepID=A0A835C307_9POAL|nr:hypothetical protein HU200_024485 [Digitaria exilis]